jgi:hypothetical protein
MNSSIKTQKILTLAEIYQQFPNQWVLIVDPELDENLGVIRGEVVAFAGDRDDLYDQLHLSNEKSFAIEYTGSTEGEALALFL